MDRIVIVNAAILRTDIPTMPGMNLQYEYLVLGRKTQFYIKNASVLMELHIIFHLMFAMAFLIAAIWHFIMLMLI